jgi:hypothetical protein
MEATSPTAMASCSSCFFENALQFALAGDTMSTFSPGNCGRSSPAPAISRPHCHPWPVRPFRVARGIRPRARQSDHRWIRRSCARSRPPGGRMGGDGHAWALVPSPPLRADRSPRRRSIPGPPSFSCYLAVEKAFHGLFPRRRTSKKPRFFKVRNRRIQRRMTLSTGCYRRFTSRYSRPANSDIFGVLAPGTFAASS